MCAIAGIISPPHSPVDGKSYVSEMNRLQRHRGPDGSGVYEGDGIALGHCRLAIIDLSDAGKQPMSDETRRFTITFNGEIYNYLELRTELSRFGHKFVSRSDTEVLLAAYIHWGNTCVQHLRGMFAFAIWDSQKRTLFAARDRLGIKPFHYYAPDNEHFAFASEIKALLPLVSSPRVNAPMARAYIAYNLLDHEPGQTMFQQIRRLPPAHTLSWNERDGATLSCYWHLNWNHELSAPDAEKARMTDEFRAQFEEAMAIHLRSDVPVGTCLSGGLDSSSIVCLAASELHRRGHWKQDWQHVFSACFNSAELDERPYINEVVHATGANPHFVFPNGETLRKDLETWLWHQEEPVGGTGTYAHYCVARLASEHGIKVLLDGQGADEQLAGYRKFILVYLRQLVSAGNYSKAIAEAAAFFGNRDILRTCSFVDGRRYLFSELSENQLLFPHGTPQAPVDLGIGASLSKRLDSDMRRYSLPVLLRYEDRNTMAFGIESRVPFVDHVFVEFMARLPADLRLHRGWTKQIMRRALRDVLPEKVRTRKTKLGFSTPENDWLATPLAPWIRATLESPRHVNSVVDGAGIRKLLSQFVAGHRSGSLLTVLFRLATFETWARLFLNQGSSAERIKPSAAEPAILST